LQTGGLLVSGARPRTTDSHPAEPPRVRWSLIDDRDVEALSLSAHINADPRSHASSMPHSSTARTLTGRLVAGRRHRAQLVVEAWVDAPATGQAQVHRCELADPQASKVVLDVLALSVDVRWRAPLPAVIVAHLSPGR